MEEIRTYPKDLEEAKRMNCEIRRDVIFYAIRPDGVQVRLNHDCTMELINQKLDGLYIPSPDMIERGARAIASELGWELDTLYENKQEWTDDRGARHDINIPYKRDIHDAAKACLTAALQGDK